MTQSITNCHPSNKEIVYGWDEKFEIWCLVSYNENTNSFSDKNGSRIYSLEQMHEWKREL
jgi:hypothetical protein